MKIRGRLTARGLQPVTSGLAAMGLDIDALLAAASLSRDLLEGDLEGAVPTESMAALWRAALLATGDENLGIHLAAAAPVGAFEVNAYAILASPTLRDGFRRSCRYQRLIHEANELSFEEGPAEGVVRHALPGGRPAARQPAEFLVAVWLRFGRLVAGRNWQPNRACFAHAAPADLAEHRRVFGERVLFSAGQTALHVPNEVLDAPNAGADAALLRVLDRYAETRLRWAPSQATLAGRVRAALFDALGDETPSASTVAAALGTSVRTLHRGLRGEGTTFRILLEQLRRERAAELLSDRRCTIAEAAFLLGFSELSAFYRAFKRWTGSTPAEFRARAAAAAPRPGPPASGG